MKNIIPFIFIFWIQTLYAQDTMFVETNKTHNGKCEYYKAEWILNEKVIKSISIQDQYLWAYNHHYNGDTVNSKSFRFETHIPKNADSLGYSSFYMMIDFQVDTITGKPKYSKDGELLNIYYLGKYLHPCQCLANVEHTKYPDLDCILKCKFDTNYQSNYYSFYKEGKLINSIELENGKYVISEKREYDNNNNLISEKTRCDTFKYAYDSLNRLVYSSYNYSCDKFKYELNEKYIGTKQFTYSTRNGVTKLSSIKKFKKDSSYIETIFYSDSTIETRNFDKEKRLIKSTKKKDGKLLEDVKYEYQKNKNEEVVICNKNGKEYSKTTKTFKIIR